MKKKLDELWYAGLTPRVTVDAMHPDVLFPSEVKKKWGVRMAIDLEPGFTTTFDDHGITVDLTFHGTPARCVIPWKRIYIIAGRDMVGELHHGVLIGANIPDELREHLKGQIREHIKAGPEHGEVDLFEELPPPHETGPVMTQEEAEAAGVAPVQVTRMFGKLRSIKGGKN